MPEPTLAELLPTDSIATGTTADDWRGAVRAAGALLVGAGATTAEYTDEMLATVDTHGPYIVIAPGLALAHARPSPAVLRTAMSWASLAKPVEFGHPQNDPVRLVVGLAAVDQDGHRSALARLARMLADPARLAALTDAADPAEVHALITDYEADAA
ncbi:PTS system ascorbate-specific IIA component [Murinocardiopsis flavida]|uniref:Ascorbate-specific PTS system EIIA component n=1 Tax=Murinocardiopsis flavida TaxID=645275 RepID=A0A2P8DH82_9ACTN|nr:PTS sugar transporter subunit IIA [Murinocardiopsis flavida]PSK96571.1 PTS system ascorbate-specific IIA component [Murinocardiopsis flavida]